MKRTFPKWFGIAVLGLAMVPEARSQSTAFISDAWWTYRQDCDGDALKAGTLAGDFARLNWAPDVINCNGTLTVFEVVSHRSCGTATWTPIYTNAVHTIRACSSAGQQYVDIQMGSGVCRDFRIQVFRNGQAVADYSRSPTNDLDLFQHREELLAEDFCLSDFFSTCVALSGSFGSQSDNNTYATREPGEPAHAGNGGGHSLWYCWTAPTNRPVTFDTIGSGFDTLLAIYAGNDILSLTVVTNNDDIAGWTNRFSKVTFTPVTGTTYRIALDGFGGASGLAVLNWNQTGAALPDLIIWGPATAESLSIQNSTFGPTSCDIMEGCLIGTGTHRLLRFDNETRNIGSGDLVLGNPATNPLFVWASCHGHYHFEQYMQYDLLDTNGNVAAAGHKVGFCLLDVGIWSPTANPSSKYSCSFQGIQSGWYDVYSSGLPCQYIDITAVPPGDYLLQMVVNPDNLIAEANYDNNLVQIPVTIPPATCTMAPTNDNFANAMAIAETPYTFLGVNNCATEQSGEPNHAGNGGGRSIWFNWTPVSNQTAVITTKRSNFDTLLGVYTGASVSTLTLIASNDDISTSFEQSQVSFSALAGTTYRIAVDGFNGAVGTVALNVGPPGNDDFPGRYLLAGTSGTTNGSTFGASKEPSEPAHAADVGGHSIWYRWTAPGDGPVDFNTRGSSFDTTLAVYTNTVLSTTQTPVAADDDDAEGGGWLTSRLSFYAKAGTTYQIAVDGFGGDSGDVTLNWNMESRLEISRLADGNVGLNLIGVDWQRYTLLGSANLMDWNTNAPTITMSDGSHFYTNSPATNASGRLYFRAIRMP